MDLLKQAILDAEQLRETAMESAKAAILETFQPRIQRLVSQKLAEEEEHEEEEEEEEHSEHGEESYGKGGEKMSMPSSDGEESEYDGEGGEEMEEPIEEPISADDLPDEDQVDEDISDFLASLVEEEDGISDDEIDYKMESHGEDDGEEDEFTLEIVEGDDDMDDEDDMMKNERFNDDVVLEIDDLDVRRSLPRQSNSEVRRLTAENKKLRSAVVTLRSAVNEVKLLNTKLNYVAKLSNAYNMSKSQQVKMLESFDNAANSREARLVYETYTAMYNKAQRNDKFPALRQQSASKKLTAIKESVAPRSSDPRRDRLQRLANIKPLHD